MYSLSGNGSNQFVIDNATGDITTTADGAVLGLDRETQDEYHLYVTAADLGGADGNLNTTIPIVIYIDDVNDETPVFESAEYSYTIAENTSIGISIGKLQATDDDIDLNARILFSVVNGSYGNFDIERYSGDLVVSGILDRETMASYVINISAFDTGDPILESYTVVTIDILDINDNSPVFSSDLYVGSIEESVPLGSYVLTVNAEDDDEETNAEFIYSINSTDFRIDPLTGKLTELS